MNVLRLIPGTFSNTKTRVSFGFRYCSNMIVQVEEGKLQGIEKTSLHTGKPFNAFLGIPYAKPPVGDLRFKPPVPIGKWDGIHDASKEGDECVQINMALKTGPTGSEDCLYLNVYTPEAPSKIEKKKAVMVWIHGGGFFCGSGSPNMYGVDYLIEHDVICVTLNYRLHILGFLNTGTPSCPGNAGLKDQLLALKWVKKNIANFGGDPDNITLFGESAGGSSVHLLMVSPLSKGLYNKAIIQSGSALCPWAFVEDPESHARTVGKLAGYEGNDLEGLVDYLKTVPAKKLCDLANQCHEQAKQTLGLCATIVFIPSAEKIKEGALLPDVPEKLIETAPSIPSIVGYNNQEGLLTFLSQVPKCLPEIMRDLSLVVKHNFHLDEREQAELLAQMKEFYFQNEPPTLPKVMDLYTDLYFLKFYESFDYLIHSNSPPYVYLFTYDGKLNFLKNMIRGFKPDLDVEGAAHGDDLGYLFVQDAIPTNPDEVDKKMRNQVCTLWTNFAKTGQPTCTLPHVDWRPHTPNSPSYLKIEEPLQVVDEKLYEKRLGFWKNWAKKFRR